MIARVCHRCHEYVTVTENYLGQLRVKAFEQEHPSHPLGNVDVRDLAGYINVSKKFEKQTIEPEESE